MTRGRSYLVAAVVLACVELRTAAATDVYHGSFTCTSGPLSLHLPPTYPELLTLGKVVRIADGQVQDYGTYKVTYRGLQFEGLELTIYIFSNDPNRYLLSEAVVTGSNWQIAPVQVGQSAQSALQHAGWPPPVLDGSWQLGGDTDSVSVSITAGRITKLTYSCDAE